MDDDDLQAIQAAAKALLPWANEMEVELFEWYPCDECPTPGQPCACSGQPWPSEPVQAAIAAALHATRDRHADLEMQVAELRDLLEQSISRPDYDSDGQCNYCRMDIQRISRHSHCWQCGLTGGQHLDDCRIDAALQTDGPAREQAILQEVQRLRKTNAGLYRQAMAKELRALQEFRRTVFAALPVIWPKGDPHADTFRKIAEVHNALDQAAQREADDKSPPPPCPVKGCNLPHEDIR